MIYETLERSQNALAFRTHRGARRGRGILYATVPWVLYLLILFALSVLSAENISYLGLLRTTSRLGLVVAAASSGLAYFLGRRRIDNVRADEIEIEVSHTSALGSVTRSTLRYDKLVAFAVDRSLRSLGADVLLVAVTKTGERIAIVEGEPHSKQIHDFAVELSRLSSLPLNNGADQSSG